MGCQYHDPISDGAKSFTVAALFLKSVIELLQGN